MMHQSTHVKTEFVAVSAKPHEVEADLCIIPVFENEEGFQDLPGLDAATNHEISRAQQSGEFRGRVYEWFLAPLSGGKWAAKRVVLMGAGRPAQFTAEIARRVAAAAGYVARNRAVESVAWIVRPAAGLTAAALAQAAADGLSAAEFDSAAYKHRDEVRSKFPSTVKIASESPVADAVARGRIIGASANATRTLCNEPGNVLTPREFASRVAAMSSAVGLGAEVIDEEGIRKLKMGLLLGVAQGSAEPPRLIVIRHDPAGAPESPVLGFVGKGITFDSGGISIKPADGMERMKDDMAGGAAVAGALHALAQLKCPYRVIGVIPTTENMPGGRATRPGDVLTGASGKTVEVINTDAEGRLILGDALWYAQQLGATHLVDVATLTGACMVALGRVASGLFGNPDTWVETVRAAAVRAGDRVWPMPLYDEYREQLRSEIADMINSAGRPAGAVTAAWFLREFVDDRPWAHLDIAGTAWAEERKAYQPKGATGVAVRLLIELAMSGARPIPA